MLKTKMAGIPIAAAEHKWSKAVIEANQKAVDLVLPGREKAASR